MSDESANRDYSEIDHVLEPDDTLDTDALENDPLESGIVPPDKWSRAEYIGNTPEEVREGETLDERLAEEVPDEGEDVAPGEREPVDDRWEESPSPRTGRLTAEDEGLGEVRDPELFATDEGVDGAAAGAEEAAVHVIEDEDEM